MKKNIFTFSVLLFLYSCNRRVHSTDEPKVPACITKKIEVFSKESCAKGPNVKEYTFQGKSVFVFSPDNCGADMTSEVVDKDCTSLGYLGGFTGNFKINGEDFSHAALVKTIWEK